MKHFPCWVPLLLGLASPGALAFSVTLDARLEVSYLREVGSSTFEVDDDLRFSEVLEPETNYGLVVSASGTGFPATENVSAEVVARYGAGWGRFVGTGISVIGATSHDTYAVGTADFEFAAHMSDTVTINAAGLAGTQGSARLGMLVDGVFSAFGQDVLGQSGATTDGLGYITVTLTGATVAYGEIGSEVTYRSVFEPGAVGSFSFNDSFLGGTLEFTYGQPIAIEVQVVGTGDTRAFSDGEQGGAPASSIVVIDVSRTVTWAGVEELRDAFGNPVLDFTAVSSSGVDFRNPIVASPVPTPASLPLLATGLVVLAWRFRSRGAFPGRRAPTQPDGCWRPVSPSA